MTIKGCLRTAAWASVFALAVTAFSCDALNPALVGQLGGNASTAGPAPTGSIVLIFNNQTARWLSLNYNLEISQAGRPTVLQEEHTLVVAPGAYWTVTFDCNTSAAILESITPVGTDDDDGMALAVNEFRRPALQCGSVIFVNVPLLGSPTADLLP